MSTSRDVEIECEVRGHTVLAIKIYDGKTECWIPRSAITDYCGADEVESSDTTSIFVPEWLALEKGLI